jgi:hypothetical protein
MTATVALRRLPRVLAAALLAVVLVAPAAPSPVRAAGVTFGTPEAKQAYNEAITFTVEMTASVPLKRVELRLVYPGAIGPFISVVEPTGSATQTLRYELDLTGGSHMVPNTVLEATWAAIPQDGSAPVLSETKTVRYEDTTQEWKSLKGDVVTVHWVKGDESFARSALKIGDDAIASTAKLLGVTETKTVDFFIYPDANSFFAALGPSTGESTVGQAHASIRTLFALIAPDQINDGEVERVIPHELVHLVFDTAVKNPYRYPPHWLNEGLAVYLSEGNSPYYRNLVADGVATGDILPLTALAVSFPRGDKVFLAYGEAVSAVDYLVATFGEDALWSLVKSYKEGLTDDEAFVRATSKDAAGFEADWLDNLGATMPAKYGPQSAPPGPVPPGWNGSGSGTPVASPGAGNGSAGRTPAPASTATAAPGSTGTPASSGGGDGILILAAVGVVILVVVAGMLIARRRTAGP